MPFDLAKPIGMLRKGELPEARLHQLLYGEDPSKIASRSLSPLTTLMISIPSSKIR
jgi:hypothetical protein